MKNLRKWEFVSLCAVLVVGATGLETSSAVAQPQRQPVQDLQLEYLRRNGPEKGPFVAMPVRSLVEVRSEDGALITQNGLYVIRGPDGNVTVFMGPEGVFVVDAQRKELGAPLLAEIDKLRRGRPIRIFVTTNGDAERAGASQLLREAGKQVIGGNVLAQASDYTDTAIHMAHEKVLDRLSGLGSDKAAEEGMWPKETYNAPAYDFYFNGEGVRLLHVPNAHTDGDSMVYFRKSDVIVAGDIWDPTSYPKIDLAHGGSVGGVLDGLNLIIDVAIPGEKQEGGTVIVPSHGRVGDESNVVEYRDMLAIIRDRIKVMADRGMTLDQVKAAKPTFDFDGLYGSTSGPWTTEMFVEAVYEGVKPQRARGRAVR